MSKKLLDFYTSYIANWISGGELINRVNLSSLGIKPLFDRIVTKTAIKKVICISQFPCNYDACLTLVLNDIVFRTDRNAKIYVNSYSINSKVDVKADIYKRQMASCEQRYEVYKQAYDSMNGTDKTLGKKIRLGGLTSVSINKDTMDKLETQYLSYKYIYDVLKNKGKIANTFFFVEIIADNNKSMRKVFKAITDYLYEEDFSFAPLSANSSNFLSNYAPTSYLHEFSTKEFSYTLMSDENLSHTVPYISHGYVGDGTGQLLGINVRSHTPFILNFFESGARQVVLLAATSGWGKTYLAFQIALSFIASNKHVSVIDIKGDEWVRCLKYTKGIVIDISEDSNNYVNTMRLDDVGSVNSQDAKEYFNMSLRATIQLVILVCNLTPEETSTAESLVRQCVLKLFSNAGVDVNSPKTFKYSRNLKYIQIIDSLEQLKTSQSFSQYINLIDKMKIRLESKFRNSNIFKGHEISIQEIINSPLVIYTLNKNKDQSQTIDDSIRTFMISYLDMKKISIRKSQGLGTGCFYEEMQRKSEFSSLMQFIASVVTGARSSNVVVFLLCNSIRSIMTEDMSPITSNFSSYIIGQVEDKKDYDCYRRLNLDDLIPQIEKLSDESKKYVNQFVMKYDTGKTAGTTIIKSLVRPEVIENFRTRDIGI